MASFRDLGSEYSILIHNIEGNIADSSDAQSRERRALEASPWKRPRLSVDSSYDFDGIEGNKSSLDKMAQLDEFKICNEQLKDKIKTMESDFTISKEEMIRQITFLEANNRRYRGESEQWMNKFYESKLQFQSKIRDLESQIKKLTNIPTEKSNVSISKAPCQNCIQIQKNLMVLEESVSEKVKESNANLQAKLYSEAKLFEVENELKELKSSTLNLDIDKKELKTLREKYSSLELKHKKQANQMIKLEENLRNQAVLEEEISSLKTKINLINQTLQESEQKRLTYQKLVEDEKVWNQILSKISNETSSATVNSPSMLFNFINELQQRVSIEVKERGTVEANIKQLQEKLLTIQKTLRESERNRFDLKTELEKYENLVRFTKQQGKLYEEEIKSLRELLKTFDMEFQLGKPETSKLIEMKDSMIHDLQLQLDNCRKTSIFNAEKVQKLEELLEEEKLKPSVVESDESLKNENEQLKEDLDALQQITGMDYLPHKTQVLHMVGNPSNFSSSRNPQTNFSTIPFEQLKRLRKEVKQFKTGSLPTVGKLTGGIEQSGEVSPDQSLNILDSVGSGSNVQTNVSSEKQLSDMNKLNLRLKEMFKERITSFREAVYLLTGYKMDLYTPETGADGETLTRLRLRSMYAENPQDALLFQLRDGVAELLDTEFASKLDPKYLTYLTKMNSVPAFLSNITLELFENQTFIGE